MNQSTVVEDVVEAPHISEETLISLQIEIYSILKDNKTISMDDLIARLRENKNIEIDCLGLKDIPLSSVLQSFIENYLYDDSGNLGLNI